HRLARAILAGLAIVHAPQRFWSLQQVLVTRRGEQRRPRLTHLRRQRATEGRAQAAHRGWMTRGRSILPGLWVPAECSAHAVTVQQLTSPLQQSVSHACCGRSSETVAFNVKTAPELD